MTGYKQAGNANRANHADTVNLGRRCHDCKGETRPSPANA